MSFRKVLFSLFVAGTLCGCSSDEDEPEPVENVRYYVKYEMYMPYGGFQGPDQTRRITITTEDGKRSLSVSKSEWEGIYGPFQSGSELSIKVVAEGGAVTNVVDSYVRLSVSRDKEPFVVKGEDSGKGKSVLYTSYVIDF